MATVLNGFCVELLAVYVQGGGVALVIAVLY